MSVCFLKHTEDLCVAQKAYKLDPKKGSWWIKQDKLIWICPWSWSEFHTHGRFSPVCPVLDGGPGLKHEITWLWEEMQRFYCSDPEVIKLPHAVPFAKAHCCRFMANMISPLTAVISRSPRPAWLWSLTLCQSKLVILQYELLLCPCRVLSKNKHSFVYALCLHENSHMLALSCFARVPHGTFEPTVCDEPSNDEAVIWRQAVVLTCSFVKTAITIFA